MSLLQPYKESISANISPKAVEVLNDIRNHIEDWKMKGDREVLEMGITTNEYFGLQNLGLSKASVKKYMYELAEKGFIRVTAHSGRANVYDLAKSEVASINYDLKHIDKSIFDNICYEIGEWVVDIMKEDKFVDGLSIMNFDQEVKKPRWL
jgi:predicted negative regulator of RcsB-dependent stress response